MKYVRLGKTGLQVSRICLGTMTFGWLLDQSEAESIVKRAIDLGVNFFDTANVYSRGRSEEILGSAIRDYRNDTIIATKVFFPMSRKPNDSGLARFHVSKQLSRSLERLQTNRIDLYLIHRFDLEASVENVLRTLNIAINQGKILHIGASTMYGWQFMKSLWIADKLGLEAFQVMQCNYNLLYREEEREMLPLCKDQNIGVVIWSPLGRGALSGSYSRNHKSTSKRAEGDKELLDYWYLRPQDFDIIERVQEVAAQKGVKPAQVALSWLLTKDAVTSPIIGVTKMSHLEEAVESVEVKLSNSDAKYLEELYQPRFLIGHYSGKAELGDPQD
jgi:aryl-alcohol dehydrogenase-like predicted oxidoreductase